MYSPFYRYFDIDWDHHDADLNGKLMVPFLGNPFDKCVSDGELKLVVTEDGICVRYFETDYPVSLNIYRSLSEYFSRNGEKDFAEQLDVLIQHAETNPSVVGWVSARRSWIVQPQLSKAVNQWISSVNDNVIGFKELLSHQYYTLMYWKDTEHKLNYRRFFTVNSLICLAMESDEVFTEYHRYVYTLYERKLIHGLRIDHIDGLKDPSAYIRKLRGLFGDECYIIAEKILESKEEIPEHWSLEGTSGYEFLSIVNQLFTDRQGASDLVNFYHTLMPGMSSYEELVLKNKKLILDEHMGGELENLSHYFARLGLQGGLSYEQTEHALSALLLSWPVYRIYPERVPLTGTNLTLLNEAFERAYALNPALRHELNYLHKLFTILDPQHSMARSVIMFLKRMMQFTGPLTAKGVEDTTFYIYNPLISHVEVGDTPATMGISIRSFHHRMLKRREANPQSLNATATHDTKRGEDARMRLNLLSEIPEVWMQRIEKWRTLNSPLIRTIAAQRAPSLNDEYFIYQSMIGGYPDDFVITDSWIERLQEYIVKVVREAKVISNWSDPDLDYEEACKDFIREALLLHKPFVDDFIPFANTLCEDGEIYSVAQLLVKITAPGIPDMYQGTELFDISFVDPDNRRPVDFQLRQRLLTDIGQEKQIGNKHLMAWLKSNARVGVRKLFTAFRMLNFRNDHAALFMNGKYIPIDCAGSVLAYARNWENEWLIVVVPLGMTRMHALRQNLPDIFISLPPEFPRFWTNIFTDEDVTSDIGFSLGVTTERFPVVALYARSLEQTF
jgi:(1->4)-alpha-D-glucan 1-alpha-D-glucosylmutase